MGGQLWLAKCLSGNPPNFSFLLCTCSSVFAIWKINSLSLCLIGLDMHCRAGQSTQPMPIIAPWPMHSCELNGGHAATSLITNATSYRRIAARNYKRWILPQISLYVFTKRLMQSRQLVKFETSTERPVWDYLVSFHSSLLPLRSGSSHHHTWAEILCVIARTCQLRENNNSEYAQRWTTNSPSFPGIYENFQHLKFIRRWRTCRYNDADACYDV